MSKAPDRRAAFRFGLGAETIAAWYLRFKGYRIVAFRFRAPGGEIDLIARKGDNLTFIEVKARRDLAIAREAITPRQQKRVATAARAWLARNQGHMALTLRFDAVFIAPRAWPVHIVNAFEIDLG